MQVFTVWAGVGWTYITYLVIDTSGPLYNYVFTLPGVAHRSQQESTSNGKKVRAHVLRLCVSPNFGRG